MAVKQRKLIGELLVEQGVIAQAQLEQALRERAQTNELLGSVLIRLGFITEEQLYTALSAQLHFPFVRLKDQSIDPGVLDKVTAKFATHYRLMPVKMENRALVVAIADPDVRALDELRLILGCEIRPWLASEPEIVEAIRRHYGVGASTIEAMAPPAGGAQAPTTENITELAADASIISFVNQLITQASRDRATDIHIEPFEDELRVRFRIDGILYDTPVPPALRSFQAAIISRIKIMAKLDIAERRLPQDGRIKVQVDAGELDLRVSLLPTPYGESVDVRLLSTNMLFNLAALGLSPSGLEILTRLIQKPHGIIFLTGPTGSGKTTTLYACLSKINRGDLKIITIEDPIEYQLKGITQIQVHPKIGLTFAQGLRSMLRHDPDVMMVGEVRDSETAEITIRSALTGHLVFSTLHTNDAAGGVARLLDMGIEPYLAASSVECFIAQRLVRLVCQACQRTVPAPPELRGDLGAEIHEYLEGTGCGECKQTGYKGRTAIHEFLLITEPVRDLILRRTSAKEIKQQAVRQGMRTLFQDGWDKVRLGLTTPAEVLRVAQKEADAGE